MTLPASGAISFNAINVELGTAGTTTANINQTSYRTLAGVPSGTISLSNFYGKSNRAAISYTYSASTANASLNVTSIGGYSAGTSDITITVNSGVYLYSTGTGTPGLTLSGGSSGDTITLVNNGYIMGMGGAGGNQGASGSAGGTALQLGFATTVNNTNGSAYIGGGGGGGGAGGSNYRGGGGGGAGGATGGTGYNTNGGAGGGIGSSGSSGGIYRQYCCGITEFGGGGGGGRIFAGTGGAGGTNTGLGSAANGKGGGSGGGGGTLATEGGLAAGAGGSGGSGSSSGGAGGEPFGAGGGGGWGASGGNGNAGYTGAAGGKAVNLNGYSITWTSGNTTRVYGSVS